MTAQAPSTPRNRPVRLQASPCLASASRGIAPLLLSVLAVAPAGAQSITTEPDALPVPIMPPLVLVGLAVLLAVVTFGLLRRRQASGAAALVVALGVLLAGTWGSSVLNAQLTRQFTDATGETLLIPVTPVITQGELQGFQYVDYENAAGVPLRISTIELPDFDACFPDGLEHVLPPPTVASGTACAVDDTLEDGVSCRVNVDAICKALTAQIHVTPSPLAFEPGATGVLTVANDAAAQTAAANVAATIPDGSAITVQSTTCGTTLAPGDSCAITLTSPTAEGPVEIPIAGDNAAPVPVMVTVASNLATLSVAPSSLTLPENGTGMVTVTNTASSPTSATNVQTTVPGGSNITVQSTTCPSSLAIGASCTVTFASSASEGPTTVAIAGDNTNTVILPISVTASPSISVTSPIQSNRVIVVSSMTPLFIEVTNDAASAVDALAITIADKSAAPNVAVDDSDCAVVAPGASCNLQLTSNTPYAPALLTISGSNTANSPTTLVAFSHLGGLVFQEAAGSGKVIIDVAQQVVSPWALGMSDITGATSLDDGVGNTNAIVGDADCIESPGSCAAQQCRNIGPDWYLPARNELAGALTALCSNAAVPCDFGGFSSANYWSSSQSHSLDAWAILLATGLDPGQVPKVSSASVRCVRAFTP